VIAEADYKRTDNKKARREPGFCCSDGCEFQYFATTAPPNL
jgi:hypothetical protein